MKKAATHRPLPSNQRIVDRRPLLAAARLTWKDSRGTTRFASVVTRNVSELGAFVECLSPVSIPLFRLVHFQLERDMTNCPDVPESMRHGRILSAVYRIAPATAAGAPQCLALRLMIDPRRSAIVEEAQRATA